MINVLQISQILAVLKKKQTTPQTSQQTTPKLSPNLFVVNVNGSVALTRFFLAAKKWQESTLSLILGSKPKGVTL